MILVWLLLLPLLGGFLALILDKWSNKWAKWISLWINCLILVIAGSLWCKASGIFFQQHNSSTGDQSTGIFSIFSTNPFTKFFETNNAQAGNQISGFETMSAYFASLEFHLPWIPSWGISFHLTLNSISLLLILLTGLLGMVATAASWKDIKERSGFFYFNLLWVISGIVGVFLAQDLFLFFFFWEMMLIPMYFLIGIWGHGNKTYASLKFFIFTQVGGLCFLVGILALHTIHFKQFGVHSFNYTDLIRTTMDPQTELWIMLSFMLAFATKLPAFGVHTWLPDAHTEAPTAGSLILAGVLLKTGAYGILKFVLPIFPNAVSQTQNFFMLLGMIGALYGALLAFGQKDLKRLVAYSSVSHMGMVLLGLFAGTSLALQGTVMELVCHGLSTGGLFLLAGTIQEYTHTRELSKMGGFASFAPKMGIVGIFFAMASLGLPGLGNFVGEFLILVGSFSVNPVATIFATVGLVAGAVYSLWIIQKVFHGSSEHHQYEKLLPDLSQRHLVAFGSMMVVLIYLGLFPSRILKISAQTIKSFSVKTRTLTGSNTSNFPSSNLTLTEPTSTTTSAKAKAKIINAEIEEEVSVIKNAPKGVLL
jgi:NADH-quinone oxidoreductase subunit M